MKKVSLTNPADSALNEMLEVIQDGYKTGKISKQTLTNWIVLFFWQNQFEKSVKKIRKDHEDPILILKEKIKSLEAAKNPVPHN
jgi:hypothetical protein